MSAQFKPIVFPTSKVDWSPHFGRRGLEPAEVARLELTVYSAKDVNADLQRDKSLWATHADYLPFFDIDGSPLLAENRQPARRFRLHLSPEQSAQGLPKYLSPKDSGSFAYLPQLSCTNWVATAQDASVPIAITEGEYKSIRGCKEGMHTVGLGGVYNTLNRTKTKLCTPLDKFEWDGRQVFIVYDADAPSDKEPGSTKEQPLKPYVDKAARKLCNKFLSLGAKPQLLYIAKTARWEPGTKMGLDDYFDAGGSWEELFTTSEEYKMDHVLTQLFEKNAMYVGSKSHVINLVTESKHTTTEFKSAITANKWVVMDGKKLNAGTAFIAHESRPEFDKYEFNPECGSGFDPERRVYNRWKGFPVEPVYNEKWEAVYVKFMQGLCGEHFDYVVNWFAHMVQCPWEKTTIALLCMSEVQGCGKSMMEEIHGGLLGGPEGSLYVSSPMERFIGKFNSLVANKLLLGVTELDSFFERGAGLIKDLVTNVAIQVEFKGMDSETLKSLFRLFISTNLHRPMRLDPNDRRMFVWTPPITTEQAKGGWSKWVANSEEGAKALKTNPEAQAAVMYYLKNRNLSQWDATADAEMTDEKRELIEASPTQNETVGDLLYSKMVDEGMEWVFVPSDVNAKDAAIWTKFKFSVIRAGGQKLRTNVAKGKGKTQAGYVYDFKNALAVRKDDNGKHLDGGQITAQELILSGVQALRLFMEVKEGVKGSDKY